MAKLIPMMHGGLARTLGLGADDSGARSHRFALGWIGALLALYGLSFALFYPIAVTNSDETDYQNQAQLVLKGSFDTTQVDAISGETVSARQASYPPGTAMLMAPCIALFGWRGAFLIPALSLALAVLVTARWLRDENRSALFTLVILGFAPTLVMARLTMSDVPSAAVVALGSWLFWRGLDRGAPWWLAAGFVAGASLTLRPTNPLPFIPFFAGTVLRRDRRCWALVVGGLAGLAAYLISMGWVFGDPFQRNDTYVPDVGNLHERLLLYGLGLLILVPGGFFLTLAYRGRRRPELIASFLLFVSFYLGQAYSNVGTEPFKRVVLALRYLIPILPVVAFAMAESVPRLWRRVLERRGGEVRVRLERLERGARATALVGLAIACVAVHPLFEAWAAPLAQVRDEIRRALPVEAVFITNWQATHKFLPEIEQKFRPIDRRRIAPQAVPELAERYGRVFIVFLDRTDSELWRQDAKATAEFVAALDPAPDLVLDRRVSSTDRLRIWQMNRATP